MIVRAAGPDDRDGVLALAAASLGWGSDERHARFFSWKHDENSFGPSPMWVAVAGDGRVVGFRTFLLWEFVDGARTWLAARAVDTATHPEFQGKGIFTKLTLAGLDELAAAGRDFVFNTPNDQSRPGYLKMGWHLIERLPVRARLLRAGALTRLARARTPAGKWSVVPPGGDRPGDAFADGAAVERLLASCGGGAGAGGRGGALRTNRPPEFLRWRYGFEELHYRVVLLGRSVEEGAAVFRVRPRGPATEAALCELLVPGGDARAARALVRAVGRASRADYIVSLGGARAAFDAGLRDGFLPVPGEGPTLTFRDVRSRDVEPPAAWRLALGDVELF